MYILNYFIFFRLCCLHNKYYYNLLKILLFTYNYINFIIIKNNLKYALLFKYLTKFSSNHEFNTFEFKRQYIILDFVSYGSMFSVIFQKEYAKFKIEILREIFDYDLCCFQRKQCFFSYF